MKKKEKPKTIKVKKESKFNPMDHWKGMPEFNQPSAKPIKTLLVHFATKEDMLKFSKLVGSEVTAKLKYLWFPIRGKETLLDKRWSDSKK